MMRNDPDWQMTPSDVAGPAAPANWTIYLNTADIGATVDRSPPPAG